MNTKIQYKTNKSAKTGDLIKCPVCGAEFKKKIYQQVFCCSKCKDAYWNKKDRHKNGYYREYNKKHPERYEYLIGLGLTKRAQEENYALYKYATDEEFRKYVNDSFDGGSFGCQVDLSTELENYEERFIVNDFD